MLCITKKKLKVGSLEISTRRQDCLPSEMAEKSGDAEYEEIQYLTGYVLLFSHFYES